MYQRGLLKGYHVFVAAYFPPIHTLVFVVCINRKQQASAVLEGFKYAFSEISKYNYARSAHTRFFRQILELSLVVWEYVRDIGKER